MFWENFLKKMWIDKFEKNEIEKLDLKMKNKIQEKYVCKFRKRNEKEISGYIFKTFRKI